MAKHRKEGIPFPEYDPPLVDVCEHDTPYRYICRACAHINDLEIKNHDLRKSLANVWTQFLDYMMTDELEDGTPVLKWVLLANPELRDKLHKELSK